MYSIYVLIGQRICSYPEQYMPKTLAVADYTTMEENPSFIQDMKKEHEDSKEFSFLAIVEVQVPFGEIKKRLNPITTPIQGEIK